MHTMTYYKITNNEGKSWIIPKKNMRVGLMLYQPSSIKGVMLKKLLPILLRMPLARFILPYEECSLPIDEKLIGYFNCLFKKEQLEFALFLGTPCKNQKCTIQIFQNKVIIGYCKLTRDKRIFKLFEKEQQTLNYLNSANISNIPTCIDCRDIDNEYYVFVQSTIKTLKSSINHKLCDKHFGFVEELAVKTKVCIDYQHSDFGIMMQLLSSHLNQFKDSDRRCLEIGIGIVDRFYKDKKSFSFYHGDFTPWNTFEEKNRLFVFDFEYGARSCPSFMDIFHFLEQTGRLEKKLSPKELYDEFIKVKPQLQHYITHPSVLYISYLLYIFTFYNEMFDWHFPHQDIGYKSWIGQLKYVLENQL